MSKPKRLHSMYGISGFTWPQMLGLFAIIFFVAGLGMGLLVCTS